MPGGPAPVQFDEPTGRVELFDEATLKDGACQAAQR